MLDQSSNFERPHVASSVLYRSDLVHGRTNLEVLMFKLIQVVKASKTFTIFCIQERIMVVCRPLVRHPKLFPFLPTLSTILLFELQTAVLQGNNTVLYPS